MVVRKKDRMTFRGRQELIDRRLAELARLDQIAKEDRHIEEGNQAVPTYIANGMRNEGLSVRATQGDVMDILRKFHEGEVEGDYIQPEIDTVKATQAAVTRHLEEL